LSGKTEGREDMGSRDYVLERANVDVRMDERQKRGVPLYRAKWLSSSKYAPRTANRPKEQARAARRARGAQWLD
jgi:hypothetical protein